MDIEKANAIYDQLQPNYRSGKCSCSFHDDGKEVTITIGGEIPNHADLRTADNLILSGKKTLLGNDVKLPEKIGVSSYESTNSSNSIKSPYEDGEEFKTMHPSHVTIFPKGMLNGVTEMQLHGAEAVYFPKGTVVPDNMKLTGIIRDSFSRHSNATYMEICGYIPEGIDLSSFDMVTLNNIKSIGKNVTWPKKIGVNGDILSGTDLSDIEELQFINSDSAKPVVPNDKKRKEYKSGRLSATRFNMPPLNQIIAKLRRSGGRK